MDSGRILRARILPGSPTTLTDPFGNAILGRSEMILSPPICMSFYHDARLHMCIGTTQMARRAFDGSEEASSQFLDALMYLLQYKC